METEEEIAGERSSQQQQRRPIISDEQVDIEAYVSLYTGRSKISRLMFIANNCDNDSMKLEALRLAYDEIKKVEITHLHREVVVKINGRLGSNYGMDLGWINAVDRKYYQRKRKLEKELKTLIPDRSGFNRQHSGIQPLMAVLYRPSTVDAHTLSSFDRQIKESIRMVYNDLVDLYYACGALVDASTNYDLTRDYCTTPQHIIHMCLNLMLVNIEMDLFPHVVRYVRTAEQNKANLDHVTTAKLHCASGLAYLEFHKYKHAAHKFLEIAPELGNKYSEVIAAQDIATYGGLCALASFDRAELKAKVIDNINFGNFLELVPQVRELIHDFYSSRYGSCLDNLGKLKTKLMLDIHLHDHVETIFTKIRNKALIQYTCPFVSVDLNTMANAFKTTVAGIQKELEALITDDQIQARIDSQNKILYARHADQRTTTFQRVLQTGLELDRDIQTLLLRANFANLSS